jgi:hypothetical protein
MPPTSSSTSCGASPTAAEDLLEIFVRRHEVENWGVGADLLPFHWIVNHEAATALSASEQDRRPQRAGRGYNLRQAPQ